MFKAIDACRICGNKSLEVVLELGEQSLTGIFPKSRGTPLTRGPLTLVKCVGDSVCGLLQLAHSYSLDEMYGEHYGYRSGLNPSMVAHLRSKVRRIKSYGLIEAGDILVDIGSNDGTTLKQYELDKCRLVGIDPTGEKFRDFYADEILLIPDFFSARIFKRDFGNEKAKVITSFSVFYDMENPIEFMSEVRDILTDDGIWIFEQSYMPSMLAANAYDTVCHEHLEYYALEQIRWMVKKVGLKIVDVELNDVNGGSFSVVVQKSSGHLTPFPSVTALIERESNDRLNELETYAAFSQRVRQSRKELLAFLHRAKATGRRVVGLGASTKGNVVLQYCGINEALIDCIGEVNQDKFGAYTPGTHIPIRDEAKVLAERPDALLVLPWHFRRYFEEERRYIDFDLVYPLPHLSHRQ